MLDWLQHSPIVKGALSGFVSAAAVDLHAMFKFTGWKDFSQYNWSTATFRWAIGLVTGALTAAGLGAI